MKKLFPKMYSRPKNATLISIVSYWAWAFVLVPWWLPYMSFGLWSDRVFASWLDISYHTFNGIMTTVLLKNYLKDEWFMVTTDVGHYLGHGLLTTGLMAVVTAGQIGFCWFCGVDVLYMLNGLPVTEMSVAQTAGYLVSGNPVFGTVCMVIFAPVCLCGLFYALGFAPVCSKRPWVAYLTVTAVTLIPALLDIVWRGDAARVMDVYFLQLPIHLLACWSYQKTDNIFTPMISLSLMNLLGALANIFAVNL